MTLEAQLSMLVHDMVSAVNNRTFNAKSYPWRQATEDFRAATCYAEFNKTTNLEDFLYCFDCYTAQNPNYVLHVKDTAVVFSEGKANKAVVFVNFECAGTPQGVVKHSVGVLECERMLGKWITTKYECLPGLTVYRHEASGEFL